MNLTGPVHIAERDALLDDVAGAIMGAAQQAIESRGAFHLALSGGSTPEPLYVRMVIDPRFRLFPWEATHVWIVDERRVPHDDDRSNYRMIRQSLLDHVPMRRRQVHPMPVEGEDPAGEYERQLQRHLPSGRLDFVLLGMGADGHTASLFPHSPALVQVARPVVVNDGPHVTPPPRVTMTYPLLNAARHVAVLVIGASKAATLRRIEAAGADAMALPITGVDPTDGEVMWYLDRDAAGR